MTGRILSGIPCRRQALCKKDVPGFESSGCRKCVRGIDPVHARKNAAPDLLPSAYKIFNIMFRIITALTGDFPD
ncbi:MAG: hypothetical protein APR53_10805 [Methanoculleus sp. SDB]|nr:MAG: hypothetical protein APR53_10805 [Methanoculleus sp. SDB]